MKKSLAILLSWLMLANMSAAVSAEEVAVADESTKLSGEVFGVGTDVNGSDYSAVFDGNTDTYFEAEEEKSEAYVGIKLDSPVQLTEIRVTPVGAKENTDTKVSEPLAQLEELPSVGVYEAEAAYEDGTIVWFSNGGFSNSETAKSLFDHDLGTKWCHQEQWSFVTWEVAEPISITGYQLVTANDNEEYPGRIPLTWVLKGCNDYDVTTDEGSWEVIDTVSDSVAEGLVDLNWATSTFTDFDIEEVPAFKFYCFEVEALGSAKLMQLSEFVLLSDDTEAPVFDADAYQSATDVEAIVAVVESYAAYETECADYTYPASGTSVPDGSVLINGARIGDVVGWDNNGASATFAAFDGNFESFFDPMTMGISYCGLDAAEEMILTKIMINSRDGQLERFNGARIQGSNDMENWIDIFVSDADAAEFAMIDYSDQIIVENNTGYRYFRYFNEDIEGDVAEIELYGYAKDGSNPTYEPFVFKAADYYDEEIKEYLASIEGAAKLKGLEIQGTTDGDNWVTLYKMEDDEYAAETVVIPEDGLYWQTHEYTFDQFRAINYMNDLVVAEIALFGEENPVLSVFSYEAYSGDLLEGTPFGSTGNEDTSYDMVFDNDTDTYFKTNAYGYAGVEFDQPVQLAEIRLTPRRLNDLPEIICHDGVEGFGGENYEKLFDYNRDTKWCVVDETPYVVWEMPEAVAVTGYQVVTANDTSDYGRRNPESWILYGATDLDSDWEVIDEVTDGGGLEAVDYTLYEFTLEEASPEYKYFMLEFVEDSGEEMQLSGFNLLYDGCPTQEMGDENAEVREKLAGLEIQGSSNGEDWITLYRFPWRSYVDDSYTIGYHKLGSAAKEYKYTMFRVYNEMNEIELAELDFYGITDSQLPEFPAEVTEPIYSYVDAYDIFEYDEFDDWDYIYNEGNSGINIWDEFENPVFIIGGALPDNTVVDVSEFTSGDATLEVIGYSPCAFYYDDNVVGVAANENLRYVGYAAFGACYDLTTVEINKYLRYVESRAFAWNGSFTEFYGAEELLSEEEIEERGGKYLNTRDGYLYSGDTIITYPEARNAGGHFTVPSDIKYIADHAFNCTQLKSVDLGESVEEIGWVCFATSSIEEITFSPTMRKIGDGALCDTKITEVVIPASVTEVIYGAFTNNPNLTKVTILSTGDFNEGSANSPYDNIFDMDESTGKSVPVVYLYEGTQAHEAAIASNWQFEFLEEDDDTDAPKIVVSSVNGKAGDTVEVTVSLENNPGIASLGLIVEYDEDILTLNQITYNTEIGGMSQQPQTLNNPVKLTWINGTDNTYGDWVFATMIFTISETIADEVSTPITITYDAEDIYDISETNIDVEVVNGGVNVIKYEPGDINEDGKVNNKDLTRLFQYIAGWDVDYNTHAIDVNGDGKINNKDLTRLFQYIAGWDVEIY